jgi:hypothetical protein
VTVTVSSNSSSSSSSSSDWLGRQAGSAGLSIQLHSMHNQCTIKPEHQPVLHPCVLCCAVLCVGAAPGPEVCGHDAV